MFEQDLNTYLAQKIALGTFMNANLTGVQETTFVGDAICQVLNPITGGVEDKKIFLYKSNDIIYHKFMGEVNKTKIPVIEPKRIALEGEILPITEVLDEGTEEFPMYVQIRYDFLETNEAGLRYFNFKYVDVPENDREIIINAVIRLRYSQDQENALLRKKLMGFQSLEFLKFNNYVTYAKAVADGLDLTAIKTSTVFEITIPLELCAIGYDYGSMAFETIIKNISFEADAINGIGKAYPTWLAPQAQAVLQSDPRVSLTEITLHEEV